MAFKIYTKTGDQGETSLFGGKRLLKSHLRIESYGTVDELNSFIGVVRDSITSIDTKDFLTEIQNRLFDIGSNLAVDSEKPMPVPQIDDSDIQALEKAIDTMDLVLPPLKNFILPSGHTTVSFCHVARTVCRRAERHLVALAQEDNVNPILIQYLNRLSDYLFTLARKIALDLNVEEITWKAK